MRQEAAESFADVLASADQLTDVRCVAAYVAREIGRDGPIDTAGLLAAVADAAGWHADALHQAIWRFEARRAHELPSSA